MSSKVESANIPAFSDCTPAAPHEVTGSRIWAFGWEQHISCQKGSLVGTLAWDTTGDRHTGPYIRRGGDCQAPGVSWTLLAAGKERPKLPGQERRERIKGMSLGPTAADSFNITLKFWWALNRGNLYFRDVGLNRTLKKEYLLPGKGRQLQVQQTLPMPASTGHARKGGGANPEGQTNHHHPHVTMFYLGVLLRLLHQENSKAALGFPWNVFCFIWDNRLSDPCLKIQTNKGGGS